MCWCAGAWQHAHACNPRVDMLVCPGKVARACVRCMLACLCCTASGLLDVEHKYGQHGSCGWIGNHTSRGSFNTARVVADRSNTQSNAWMKAMPMPEGSLLMPFTDKSG
eukprot:360426-Chlamydomonas_euryale.AAC.4